MTTLDISMQDVECRIIAVKANKSSIQHLASSMLMFALSALFMLAGCIEPDPKVWKLDEDYGFRGFSLGSGHYERVMQQAKANAMAYDILEFETFGSKFADQQPFEQQSKTTIFGAPAANVFAGILDKTIYAFLFQIEADEQKQMALVDSLILYYGQPQSEVDTTYISGETFVRVKTRKWEAETVGMELGEGEGFAEIFVYDRALRQKRERIQYLMTRSQRTSNETVNDLRTVGDVSLDEIARRARWKYRYRGEETHVRGGSFGEIDYDYVKPFFEVEGESFFGVKMAFVNLNFMGGSDSLKSIEVRFDNTQGQTVGFMDMLQVMERKLGRHSYSDTLHTAKGPFRRATWHGDQLTVTLEENRYRPENPDRADVVVSFLMDRVEVPWTPPEFAVNDQVGNDKAVNDSLNIGSGLAA